jgi:dTDP-4-dehydrorhamnose 3,5-epimerase
MHGLASTVEQCNISFNRRSGTIRGLHFQRYPSAECKLIRCTRGAIFDVAVDIRPFSPTFLRWEAFELTSDNHDALYLPAGIAHGFQTLVDESEVYYQMSANYDGPRAAGIRWDDARIGIEWPLTPTVISDRDRTLPTADDANLGEH